MSVLQAAERFLDLRRIAVVGVSRDPRSFTRRVFEAFLSAGYDAVPVNPAGGLIGDRPAFSHVSSIEPPVEGVFVLVAPGQADEVTAGALAAGVRQFWFHRGGGVGSASTEALARCAGAGIDPVTDLCPFMMLPRAGWFHRLHGYLRVRKLVRAA